MIEYVELMSEKARKQALYLIENTNDREMLCECAYHWSNDVLKAVVKNTNTPPRVLSHLARHTGSYIQGQVAKNPNIPVDVLWALASVDDLYILESIVFNPQTTPELLNVITQNLYSRIEAQGLVKTICFLSKVSDETTLFLWSLPNSPFRDTIKCKLHLPEAIKFELALEA